MTIINTYDQSSTGTSIEFRGHYDTHLSQIDFDENFEKIRDNHYYYTDSGQLPNRYEEQPRCTLDGDDKGFLDLFKDYIDNRKDALEHYTMEEIKEQIYDYFYEDFNAVTIDFNRQYTRLKQDYNLTLVMPPKLSCITTRGYCQGDIATVWYCLDDITALWDKEPSEKDLRDMFHHYFWDCPIHATLTINSEEYYDEYYYEGSQYEWQRDEFIAHVAEQANVPVEILEAIVPKELDYN